MICMQHQWASCAGVQLVKMTPFRSSAATFYCLEAVAILSAADFKGGVISYAVVSHPPLIRSQHTTLVYPP